MRIVVNDIAAECGGALTILRQFYDYIRKHDTENEWIFLLSDSLLEETKNIKVRTLPIIKKSGIIKIFFDCVYGRYYINHLNPDLVLSMQNIITFGVKAPQAVYIHQSIPFQDVKNFSFFKKNERAYAIVQHLISHFIFQSAKKADRVFVQTHWMKKAVSQKTKIELQKIDVVFPSVIKPLEGNYESKNNLFFYPSNVAVYKNHGLLVQACNILNDRGYHDFHVLLTLPEGRISHPNIRCVGTLQYEEMQEMYHTSTLLFPSYIETVGLPLLEARACNALIFASDTPFAHECLDGYDNVYFFQYEDSGKLANLMEKKLTGCILTKNRTVKHGINMAEKDEWAVLYNGLFDI